MIGGNAMQHDSVKQILSNKGKKLKAHEIHVRRTTNKGYVIKHQMRDSSGQPPMDGQAPEQEYHANNLAELQAHMGQHFGPQEPDDDEAEPATQSGM
jgi:hypothetical protein